MEMKERSKNIEKARCVTCGKTFWKYKRDRKNHSSVKFITVRAWNALTCSRECSRRYKRKCRTERKSRC